MNTARQQTVAEAAKVKGLGVHSGERVTLTIIPADEGHGRVFCRSDLPGKPCVPATIDHIQWDKMRNRTTLGKGEAEVQTPEHVLSALHALGVDNALIELTGVECPGIDNSALPFVEAIEKVGLREQSAPRRVLTLSEPVTVRDEKSGAEVTAMPSERFEVTFFVEFPDDHFLGPQTLHFQVTPEAFRREVAKARTWIFAEQIPGLLLEGLGQGGTMDSVLVIGRSDFVTPQRMDEEPVRHKAMDLIGDLALLDCGLQAHVLARRSGHRLHAQLVQAIQEKAVFD